jgi:hypothetical protein
MVLLSGFLFIMALQTVRKSELLRALFVTQREAIWSFSITRNLVRIGSFSGYFISIASFLLRWNVFHEVMAKQVLILSGGLVSPFLFLCGAIKNHAHFFQCDQSALDHFVQTRKNLLDAFRGFDHFHDNRQIL